MQYLQIYHKCNVILKLKRHILSVHKDEEDNFLAISWSLKIFLYATVRYDHLVRLSGTTFW